MKKSDLKKFATFAKDYDNMSIDDILLEMEAFNEKSYLFQCAYIKLIH